MKISSLVIAAFVTLAPGVFPVAAFAQSVQNSGAKIIARPFPYANLPAGFSIVHPKDGAEMVWIPEGWFRMGINADVAQKQAEQLGYKDYHQIASEESFPERHVFLAGFFIDKTEVTIARWKKFADETKWTPKDDEPKPTWSGPEIKAEEGQLPIASITWRAAQEYANWAGKQLPTEAMWEKAARGTDGRWYPWGNELPNPKIHGVLSLGDALPGPQAVGSFPLGASPYGALDMAGNVYEWTSEWMEPYPNSPEPSGSWGHRYVVLRGGSFYHTRHSYRTSKRFGFEPHQTYFHVGLRTAWTPPDDFDARKFAAK